MSSMIGKPMRSGEGAAPTKVHRSLGTTRPLVTSISGIPRPADVEPRTAAFQKLVADLASRLSAIAPEAVDEAIADSLRQAGEALQLECAVLWRRKPDELKAVPLHAWIEQSCGWSPEPVPVATLPAVMATLEAGDTCCFASVEDLPERDREVFRRCGFRSGVVVPVPSAGELTATALAFASTTREHTWTSAIVERLRLVAGVMGQALARKGSHLALQKAQDEIRELRDRLASEQVEHRRDVKTPRSSLPMMAFDSLTMRQVFSQLEQVAPTPATVLLLGETGSGKEVIAQAIHDMSPRHQRPMIKVSCAAIPTALIESELFGRERGAYTGAVSRQAGRFEAASGSTLFLDEIGDLPMEVQVKLLRVLQERVIERLGSTQSIKVDVRIIAATNRNLEDAVRNKTFREDLFYRLNVFPVVVPPLRDRVEDIPTLVWTFVDEFSRSFGKTIDSIPKECLRELQRYPWPGNVRELRNVVERAVIVATGRQLIVWPPRTEQRSIPQAAMTLSALESEHIRTVLESTNWRVRGMGGAAERLGLKPTTLESRMARLGITRKQAAV
jgi:transcriptional regulator with GAF, ATPase, and Fis domain